MTEEKTYEKRFMNIPADAKVVIDGEEYETARQFVDELRSEGWLACTEEDGPETLQIPCDALRDGNPQGFTTFVTDTYERVDDDRCAGQVQVIWAFTPEETEGKLPEDWPWDDAYLELAYDRDDLGGWHDVFAAWTVVDLTDSDHPYECTFRSAEGALREAMCRWQSCTDAERRSCVYSREHRFLVLDPLGMTVRDFGEDLGRLIARRQMADDTVEHLDRGVLEALANRRGHDWVDSAYALADAWDGTETVPLLMKQYGMSCDEANDMLDALTAIHVLAQRREE